MLALLSVAEAQRWGESILNARTFAITFGNHAGQRGDIF
jgi:hypothetical protein